MMIVIIERYKTYLEALNSECNRIKNLYLHSIVVLYFLYIYES